MKTLRGKSVVVTGAASGIGRALALSCAAEGARLLLADLDEAGLSAVAQAVRTQGAGDCHAVVTDTGDEAAIHALAAHAQRLLGGADVVFNNAGVSLVAPVESLESADAHWLMNINFWGVVHGCRAFIPQMRARPEAVLVNVSSVFAMVSVPTQSMYNASKAAVRAFSDALREELRGTPVRVLCVHPGGIRTNIARRARIVDLSDVADSAEQMHAQFDQVARTTPEQAAARILRALRRGDTRLMIGADARALDLLYRAVPSRASAWLVALARRQRVRRTAR